MSSEESYRAILRYLTNECEPYAPGTEGNVKRKIRKAAACYVVRDGILYYQRRQRHRKTFAELEVVLQPERRWGLIEAAHLGPGGTHHTQHQTWHDLSKTYWWRGRIAPAVRGRAGGMLPRQGLLMKVGLLAEPRVWGFLAPLPGLPSLAQPTLSGGAAARRSRECEGRERSRTSHRKEAGKLGAGPDPGWGEGGLLRGRASLGEGLARASARAPPPSATLEVASPSFRRSFWVAGGDWGDACCAF